MGMDFYATAAIGCKVPVEKAKRITHVRGCGCDLEEHILAFKYCPKCSSAIWINYVEWVLPHDLDNGLSVERSTDTEELIVAALVAKTDSHRGSQTCAFANIEDIEMYRSKVKSFLEPLGLWDESLFGLWAIPYISY